MHTEMRATRDLLRRRTHLMRQRAELLAPAQHTKKRPNSTMPRPCPSYKPSQALAQC